jgi:hypothetical protein
MAVSVNHAVSGLNLPTPTSYTPTWDASTPPALGNGTLVGSYMRVGKMITACINLTAGSTTTFGSGEWTFSLPVTAASTVNFSGAGWMLDNGTAYKALSCHMHSTTTIKCIFGSDGGHFNAGAPITWASGDKLDLTITYEAASE